MADAGGISNASLATVEITSHNGCHGRQLRRRWLPYVSGPAAVRPSRADFATGWTRRGRGG
ncbi:unnamed protein product [Ectocarpus sp. CCAP 1310/34]|nr:unnamed protein product [Ectocarpus sp. CCAP 1310/34]